MLHLVISMDYIGLLLSRMHFLYHCYAPFKMKVRYHLPWGVLTLKLLSNFEFPQKPVLMDNPIKELSNCVYM